MTDILSVSDLHFGRQAPRDGTSSEAFMAMVEHAIRRRMRLILPGDTLDLFPTVKEEWREKEVRLVRDAMCQYSRECGYIDIQCGNHDPVLDLEKLAHCFPNVRFRLLDPIAVLKTHQSDSILVTHGHLVDGIRRARALIDAALEQKHSPEALVLTLLRDESLHESVANEEHKMLTVIAPFMDRLRRFRLHDFVEDLILRGKGVTTRFEQKMHTLRHMRRVACWRAEMVDTTARLAVALECSLAILGHNHTAGIVRRTVYHGSGEKTQIVIANNGGYLGSDPRPRGCLAVNTENRTVELLHFTGRHLRTFRSESYAPWVGGIGR